MTRKAHFIGIGGVSMSGLAEILQKQGYTVSGSDRQASNITRHLENLGITVFIGHDAAHIKDDLNLVVHTAAVKSDNPEIIAAREKNITVWDRAQALGQLMRNYRRPVCVAGTHGKTSTTSMITEILLAADQNPTVSVGGFLPSIGGYFRQGGEDIFVVESCEYCDSFLKFFSQIGVILNIDRDHLDYFADLEAIESSFRRFAQNIAPDGHLIICAQITGLEKITQGLPCGILTYGADGSDLTALDVTYDRQGCAGFTIIDNRSGRPKELGRVNMKTCGEHNVLNALAACGAALELGVPVEFILSGLSAFAGTARRFEYKGEFAGVRVIDDYAHHPTEISATLAAAMKTTHRQIWCVFQPHTYSRTQALLQEFANCFADADRVILLDIYAAREKNEGLIHARQLADKIHEKGKDVFYFASFDLAQNFLENNCVRDDLLITMGAGDVYLLGENLVGGKLSTE